MLAAALGSLMLLAPSTLHAAPARKALVIGNGSYDTLPPLPACLLSAHAVAAALRGIGFDVVEREDASSGATDAAIGDFAKQLGDAPGAAAFVYSCGYATAFNNRPFLLPVSARIARPTDALTQGILAKTLPDVLGRGGAGAAIVALDIVPTPDAPGALGVDTLAQDLPGGAGLIAITQAKPSDAPTPLAVALVAGLKATQVQTASLLSAVQQQIGGNKTIAVAAYHEPATPGYLTGAPQPAPPPPAPPPAAPAPASPPPTRPAAAPQAAPPSAPIPDDDQMSDADRRRVQAALARLGYYDGQVDGIFGPDTRAAIRRYQHELGVDMNGRLTAAQATKLVAGQ